MSPRARVVAIVSVLALAAAGATVAGAILQGGLGTDAGGEAHGQTPTARGERERPGLELALTDRDDREARALVAAERLYEAGKVDEARRRFEELAAAAPNSAEAAIGAAVAKWPEGTIQRLRALVDERPELAVAYVNLGLALAADGEIDEARRAWRTAERVDPESPAALRAEDLRHPEMPPGRPQFVLAEPLPRDVARLSIGERLATLARRAESGGAEDWFRYGILQERIGWRPGAQRAYDRAVALEPGNVAAQTAAAVARFDKDNPSRAFSRLGPLARKHPRAAVVRFHLGFMLLWLREVDEARRQLGLAVRADPDGFYGRQAKRILERIEDA